MKGILLNENNELKIDVKRDANNKIISGLTIGDVTMQNQATILECHKGEVKHAPLLGVGITNILLDHDLLRWKIEIREQLERDGQKVQKITFTNSINIYAEYRE